MTTADELTCCDECEAEMSSLAYDANDGLCPACLAKTFVCQVCDERTAKTDAHKTHKALCESCGESRAEELHEEAIGKAADELRELAEAIIDGDDLDAIRKAIAALKRLAK